jgi:hypothetical protein
LRARTAQSKEMFISRQWLNKPVPAIMDINGIEELLESVTFMQSMSRPYIENKWDE